MKENYFLKSQYSIRFPTHTALIFPYSNHWIRALTGHGIDAEIKRIN